MSDHILEQTRKRRTRSWFIPIVGWLFLPAGAFLLFISIFPNMALHSLYADNIVDDATFPAYNRLEVLFYSNLRLFAGLFSAMAFTLMVGAAGLLFRRKWARVALSVVLGATILVALTLLVAYLRYDYEITAWRDPQRNAQFETYLPWGLAAISLLAAWLLRKLNSGNILSKLR